MRFYFYAALVTLLGSSTSAYADGLGTSVTGVLHIQGLAPNYFDPANGLVPPGYGNSTGTTVTIGPGIEFGISDPGNTDTADFTGSSLTITDVIHSAASPFEMDFTDPAFTGFTQLTNNTGFTYSFSANTLKVFYAGSLNSGLATTTFSYTTGAVNAVTPEPSAMVLTGTGLLGLAGALRRRRRTA